MTRVQRTLLVAVLALAGGGGLAAFVLLRAREIPNDERREAESARVFRWGRFDIRAFRLVNGKVDLSGACEGYAECRLVRPIKSPVDREAVGALLDNVAALPLALTLATGEEAEAKLAEYGLDPAPITFTATTADGRRHVLYVGGLRPTDRRRYIAGGEPLRLGVADDTFHWAMDRDLGAYRARQVFELDRAKITRVVVERLGAAPRTLTLEKAEPLWSVTAEGRTLPADPFVLDRFLTLLTRDLKADAFVSDAYTEGDAPRFGLDRPAFAITVTAGGADVRAHVGVGPRPDGTGDPSEANKAAPFVHVEGSSAVAVVYNELLSDLDKSLPEFRDRRVSDFDVELVRRIEILREGHPRMVLDGGAGSWRLIEPESGAARTDRAQNIALRYSKLRAARVLEDGKARLKDFGLDPPKQRVVLRADGGRILADIMFGDPIDREHVAVTAEGVDRVDAVKDAELRVLPLELDDLLRRGAP